MIRELCALSLLVVVVCFQQADSLEITTIPSHPCDPNPCLSGGKCNPDASAYGYYCACPSGSYGYKCEKQKCPSRYSYRPETDTCIRVVLEPLTWFEARKRCQEFQGGYLTIINSAKEVKDQAVLLQPYKSDLDAKCSGRYWIAAQNEYESCGSPMVWKPNDNDKYLPLTYSNWNKGEPNCSDKIENCGASYPGSDNVWNDITCFDKSCFICEYSE